MNQWHRTRPDGSVELVGPDTCANGHPLKHPNVLISSDVAEVSYLCRTCGSLIHRRHDGSREYITQEKPT